MTELQTKRSLEEGEKKTQLNSSEPSKLGLPSKIHNP
jgi:hypothetical protein